MAIDVELLLETVQAERDALARRLQEGKRVRSVLNGRSRKRARTGGHAALGLRHAIAHALVIGHARVLHGHARA